jgi:hypothetical protein
MRVFFFTALHRMESMHLAGRFYIMRYANGFRNVNVCEALVNESAF